MSEKNDKASTSSSVTNIPMQSLVSQDSTVSSRRQNAICVRRAYKTYGTKDNPNVILDGLNMTVPKGTIYGLLGASGCGKTTLLSCIVGRRRLNSGDIWVLGGKPGGRGSGVPGPRIGYMPQEVALYGEFTVKETLTYFGWLCGVSAEVISQRFEFLLELLQLPFPERYIKNLSGGQQRRVSFAAALVHDPELLILDEPTVGLDPLLRRSIWNYLVDLASNGLKTIIITTHYIDETRQANLIGLMRGGRFLAEESPDSLLQRYECESLEDVFLKLAIIQNRFKRRRSSIIKSVTDVVKIPSGEINEGIIITDDEKGEISGEFGDNISMTSSHGRISITPDVNHKEMNDIPPDDDNDVNESYLNYCILFRMYHMKALMWKNMLWMWRNFGLLCFMILLPLMQMILFCLTIGHDPEYLKLAVKNFEVNITSLSSCDYERQCNGINLSCGYLKHLSQWNNLDLEFYDSENDAKNAVIAGNAWAALTIQHNYSQALFQRLETGHDTENWDIEASSIKIWQDMSDQQIGTLLYRDFNYAYLDFIREVLKDCNINPKIGKPPLKINKAIYGLNEPNFTDFAAPGIILTIIFFMAVALTTGAILHERNEGLLERALVVGITGTEILFALVGTEFIIVLIHTGLVLSVGFLVFNLTIKGNLLWVVLLSIMTGMCGMCFGFVVSTACDNERTATYAALGCFLPIVMLCGIIWPIEGMHYLLRKIAYFLPLTLSTESIRSILQRGWSMDVPHIYNGFISTFIWIWIFLILSILVLKFKKG